jgi:hypothetical protein
MRPRPWRVGGSSSSILLLGCLDTGWGWQMRRTRATRSGALLFAFLVLSVLVSPAADAHVKSFNATLTLQYKSKTQTFFGTLGTNRQCKGDRLVTLYDADTNSPVATTTTRANGQYRISLEADGGRYYARVEQEVRGGYGHVHTCEGDQSRTINTSKGEGQANNNSASTTGTQGSGQERGNEDAPVSIFRLILSLLLGR